MTYVILIAYTLCVLHFCYYTFLIDRIKLSNIATVFFIPVAIVWGVVGYLFLPQHVIIAKIFIAFWLAGIVAVGTEIWFMKKADGLWRIIDFFNVLSIYAVGLVVGGLWISQTISAP